jgi:hypothetical protein
MKDFRAEYGVQNFYFVLSHCIYKFKKNHHKCSLSLKLKCQLLSLFEALRKIKSIKFSFIEFDIDKKKLKLIFNLFEIIIFIKYTYK